MDDFDLNMNGFERGRQTAHRRVRRHDNPDPRPTKDFEPVEERYSEVETTPRPARRNAEPQRQSSAPAHEEQGREQRHASERQQSQQADAQPRRKTRKLKAERSWSFSIDRRVQMFLGILALVVGGVMLIVIVSHMRHAAADQSKALNMTVAEMTANAAKMPTENVGSSFGVWLSHVLFADMLGVGAFVIAVYLMLVGACLCAKRKFAFWALTFKSLLLAVTVSVVTGLVTYAADSEVFWGGTHGHYVNKFLFDNAGFVGAVAVSLLLVAAVVCAFYYPLCNAWQGCRRRIPKIHTAPVRMERPAATDAREPAVDVESPAPMSTAVVHVPVRDLDSVPAVVPKQEQLSGFAIDDDEEATMPAVKPAERKPSVPLKDESAPNAEPGFEISVPKMDTDESARKAVANPAESELFDHRAELSRYKMPTLDLLDERQVKQTVDIEEQQKNKDRIVKTLADYKISIASIKATVGPTVTLYEVVPSEGIRIAQIKRLEPDIAMSLSAKGIRIIAPIPGKGTVGIEVPNNDPQTVSMRSVLASQKFQNTKMNLPVALGATIQNEVFVADLASMPHALVAGATGQGKSVGLNAIIASLLYKKHPSELKFVLIDPKMVEFSLYSKIANHYLAKLPDDDDDAIITDTGKVLSVMNSLCVEMDNRYALLKDAGVRNVEDYNAKFAQRRLNPEHNHHYMPYIVVIIDEFSDLILTAGKDIEGPVTRITQKARAVGIHMIIATQRPSTNVLTGLIKANCPARIAFRVLQMVDSRTILDQPGANQLIGRGDMLYSAGGSMERVQCAFISTDEVERIVDYIDSQAGYGEPYLLPDPLLAVQGQNESGFEGGIAGGGMDRDPLFDEAARFIISQSTASTSSLQRRFQIGYNRAGKIMDQMEAAGIVGAGVNSKPRPVLVDSISLEQILSQR